jgi:hypothetical protein
VDDKRWALLAFGFGLPSALSARWGDATPLWLSGTLWLLAWSATAHGLRWFNWKAWFRRTVSVALFGLAFVLWLQSSQRAEIEFGPTALQQSQPSIVVKWQFHNKGNPHGIYVVVGVHRTRSLARQRRPDCSGGRDGDAYRCGRRLPGHSRMAGLIAWFCEKHNHLDL